MNSNIQQKLFHYTETPPHTAWDGIAAALDESPAYAQKLYQYEPVPPPAVWDNVVQQLAAPQTKAIQPGRSFFKYAIAAAVLGIIAAGSVFYFKNGAGSNLGTQPQSAVSPVPPVPSNTQSQEAGTGAGENEGMPIQTDAEPGSDTATVSDEALVRYSPRVRIAKNRMATHAIAIMPAAKTVIDTELADRYMIATTPAGKVVRLPKKAYSDYACAEAYKNYQCKEKMASIQSKMAASVATDFTEFMDLLNKLQDNQ